MAASVLSPKFHRNELLIIIAVALGYFVDLYDLLIFSSVRVTSLASLGITDPEISGDWSTWLLNYTVIGMLIGGFIWGYLGDTKGRGNVLFMSIFIYSLANIANAFVHDIETYKWLRLIAGIGLAGELGNGLTHAYDAIERRKKQHATDTEVDSVVGSLRTRAGMYVSAIGMLGAVTAGFVGLWVSATKGTLIFGLESWRIAFLVGGLFGLVLLAFRISIREKELVEESKNRGNVLLLFKKSAIEGETQLGIVRYLLSVIVGLPLFFMIGILIGRANDFAKLNKVSGDLSTAPAWALIIGYLGIATFDVMSGQISIWFHSYIKTLRLFAVIQLVAVTLFLYAMPDGVSKAGFFSFYFLIGASIGGWTIVVINAAAQFGTNLRSFVATSVPNVIRFLLWPLTFFAFDPLRKMKFHFSSPEYYLIDCSAMILYPAIFCALIATFFLKERYGLNSDYDETSIA
jgi:MFS transporter, putative metabolite:H+ symporter